MCISNIILTSILLSVMLGIYAIGCESNGFGQQSQFAYRDYYCRLKPHIYPWGQGEEVKEKEVRLSLSYWFLGNK